MAWLKHVKSLLIEHGHLRKHLPTLWNVCTLCKQFEETAKYTILVCERFKARGRGIFGVSQPGDDLMLASSDNS